MTAIALALLALWCTTLSLIDLRTRRLPDSLTLPGGFAVLGFALFTDRFSVAVTGALLLVVPYLLVHLAAPAAFGAGDVKLAAGLGAAAACGGAHAWTWAALAAPMLTAVGGGAAALLRAYRSHAPSANTAVPHGPSMCFATVAALLAVR
ncbi:A24 family peptidase [Nocardia sp. CDC159]|uniref:A24 family peptidase n=1 Tax=Nocardia pulmonis TaxID=2951408 RepID=A0A9X2EAU9_9NOCA|nr:MULTISPECIES: A24 family peptidase [Nocardia]MCM6776825.1 A24 family peptidase [Nocardia pulmonis]MCM6789026.1 A24 family peptidase [Nocardia sp. CDC159]